MFGAGKITKLHICIYVLQVIARVDGVGWSGHAPCSAKSYLDILICFSLILYFFDPFFFVQWERKPLNSSLIDFDRRVDMSDKFVRHEETYGAQHERECVGNHEEISEEEGGL